MTRAQAMRAAAYGAAFWLAAALFVHFARALFAAGPAQAVLFAATVPVGWVSVRLMAPIAGVARDRVLRPVVVALGVATLLDGLALTWAPSLYAGVAAASQFGAAWILWGVGCFLFAALWEDRG